MGGTDWIVPGLYTQQPLTRSMRNNCQGLPPSTGDKHVSVYGQHKSWGNKIETRGHRATNASSDITVSPSHVLNPPSFFPLIFSKAERQGLGMRLGLFLLELVSIE